MTVPVRPIDGSTSLSLTGKRIIVTGASGFIASNLTSILSAVDCDIVRVLRPNATQSLCFSGSGRYEDVAADISDRIVWERILPGADIVFHLAAQTSLSYADRFPLVDWQSNVLPMFNLLESCRNQKHLPLIIFAGSATQVGLPEVMPIDETLPDVPVTVYDRHKLAAEMYLEHYVHRGWARGVTLRFSNVYGPGPASARADRGILNQMMRRALEGQRLTLYGAGHQKRDYLFVADAVNALVAAVARADVVSGRHFLVCSGHSHTLAEAFGLVAERAGRLTGRCVNIDSVPEPRVLSPIQARSFVGDSSQFRRSTGWAPQTELAPGIDITLRSMWAGAEMHS